MARSPGGVTRGSSLAGWLLADSLIVLMLVGLGSQIVPPQVQPREPAPTVTVTATETASAPPAPPPPGLKTEPVMLSVPVNAQALLNGDPNEAALLQARITAEANSKIGSGRAAFVIIWGYSPSSGRGTAISERVAPLLTEAVHASFGSIQKRTYWHGAVTEGQIDLEVFLFN